MNHYHYDDFFREDEVVCIRKSHCQWTEPPHTHEFIEFVYVANGSGWHIIDGTKYDVHKGCFLFVNYRQEHEMVSTEETVYYNILFKPEFFLNGDSKFISDNAFEIITLSSFGEFQDLEEGKSMIQFQGEEILLADKLVEMLWREYNGNTLGRNIMIKSGAMLLIAMALREMSQNLSKNIKSKITANVLDYIESHYNEKLSVAELAKKSLYQPAYFSTIFKECYGVTITEYIQNKRIETACRLLETTDYTIDEIGAKIGYDDNVRFYRYFKKICGMSPNSYRKQKSKNS